jgi:hypothetical protein
MYIRTTRGRSNPATIDETIWLYEEVAAAVRRLPGFKSYYGGLDRTSGVILSVSMFDTEAHARFSRDSLGNIIGRLKAAGVQLEAPDIYEVVTQA